MNEHEEHRLIQAIASAGLDDVANAMEEVISKQDRRFEEAITRISENTGILREISASLEEHVADESAMLKRLLDAFPASDTRGHRDAHEAWIEREKKRAALRDAIIEKSLASLVWMGLVALGIAVWHYLGDHLRTR